MIPSAETSEGGSTPNTAVLVTPPRCTNETDGVSMIESLQFRTIITDISQRLLGKESSFGGQDEEEEQQHVDVDADVHVEEPPNKTTMQELEERPVSIVLSQGTLEESGGFDVCQEYGYKYDTHDQQEEEDDSSTNPLDESCEQQQQQQPLHDQSIYVRTKTNENIPYIHLLGKTYHPILEFNTRREYEHSLFWFTYRCDFPEIVPYRITTDAGWGCMLRSAQMMLAQTLRVHFQSRHWKPAKSIVQRRLDPFISNLLTWFADFPSKTESVYSLHNMVAAGFSKYETLPGEWYGPGTACYVIRDLVTMHEQHQPSLFRVHVAPEGAVYRDAVQKLMTKDFKQRVEERQKRTSSQKEASAVPLHPLDPSVPAPTKESETLQQLEWDTGLLLLVPLRLGLNNFHQDYIQSIARSFSLPQSVGILGGRPRGARWFYGAYADGSKILGLDPHTVQTAPQKRRMHAPAGQVNHSSNSVVDLSDEYMRSVHTTYPEVFPIARMDPSIALGFYCRDKSEFAQLEAGLAQLKSQLPEGSPDLFAFADHAPDYLSSAMNDMMLMDSGLGDEDTIEGVVAQEQVSDEDEYVLL
jgi:cysteine protease ATG4